MLKQNQIAIVDPVERLGNPHPLIEQLGPADNLLEFDTASTMLQTASVRSLSALREFLHHYRKQILFPLELPAIRNAYAHASRNELRELMVLDEQLTREPRLENFSTASQRVGKAQLERLRPLRDQRFVQRYLAAVQSGESRGWHTLVHGLTLAVFSLPLRQGLHGYAERTLRGFVHAAASSLQLSETDCRATADELCEHLPRDVQPLITDWANP